jgi:hypothetical protein
MRERTAATRTGDVAANTRHDTEPTLNRRSRHPSPITPMRSLQGTELRSAALELEVSALLRFNRLRDQIDGMNVASEEQFTNVYGARARSPVGRGGCRTGGFSR